MRNDIQFPISEVEKTRRKSLYFEALEGSEQNIQDYFEKFSEVFPLPFYIGHHLQWDSLITKYPLDTSLVTDFMYVTRTSNHYEIVLVELEEAGKKIFREKSKDPQPTAEFTAAQSQIDSWRDYIRNNREAVIKRVERLMGQPFSKFVEFRYVLIYGRSAEFSNRQDRRDRFSSFSNQNIHFLTYDSVWTRFEQSHEKRRRHILKLSKDRFTFKVLANPKDPHTNIFAWLGPDRFKVSSSHKNALVAAGYEIDAWENGESLSIDSKLSLNSPRYSDHIAAKLKGLKDLKNQ